MASKDDGEKANCTITWIIENISYCWQKKGDMIKSPMFVADVIENSKWTLELYPRGDRDENYISYYLSKENRGNGVENIEIDYELAFLAADGSVLNLKTGNKITFEQNKSCGFTKFAKRSDVFTLKRPVYLPKDSLTTRCRIWKTNGNAMQTRQFFAKTIVQVERRTFLWKVEKFSLLQPDEKNTVVIESASGVILFELHLDELINIDIRVSDKNVKSLKFQTCLLLANGRKSYSGAKDILFDAVTKGDLTLLHEKKPLLQNKSIYLPNDVLTLNCEFAFSTGAVLDGFERIDFGNIFSFTKKETANALAEEKRSDSLLHDMKYLYKNEILCDTKLCTKTETFPVHSVLLSARSPIFRAMFTAEKKGKAKKCVDIPDVDADTLRQMLQYMYTDTLEISDWEKASLLYAAADKYEIISLRNMCSTYLKNNFCLANVCEILVLSDMHHDKDLKKVVQDYILRQGVIIFDSNEWMRFMEANLKLAAETMHQNWIHK